MKTHFSKRNIMLHLVIETGVPECQPPAEIETDLLDNRNGDDAR